jgi:hypothetical protein
MVAVPMSDHIDRRAVTEEAHGDRAAICRSRCDLMQRKGVSGPA